MSRQIAWPGPMPILAPGEMLANTGLKAGPPEAQAIQSLMAAYMTSILSAGQTPGFGTVASGLVGSGASLAVGTPVSASYNFIATSVSGASGFTVSSGIVGVATIVNFAASAALLFPPSGAQFNALSANASTSIASGGASLRVLKISGSLYYAW